MEPRDPAWPPLDPAPSPGRAATAPHPRPAAGLPALASLSPAARVLRGISCQVDSGPEPEAVKPSSCRIPAGQGPWEVPRLPGPLSRVRLCRFVILSVVLFGLVYNPNEACSLNLVDHGRGYLGILLSCMIAEMAIIWLSMRGGILYTEPRESMQYVLYVRLGKGHPPWVGAAPDHPHLHPPPCAPPLSRPAFVGHMQWARPWASTRVQPRTSKLTGLVF